MGQTAEFLIVGSGGGGGTMAWLLAKAGFNVTVLEQGANIAKEKRDSVLEWSPSIHDEAFYRLKKPDPKRRLRGDYNTFADRKAGTPALPFDGGWTGSVVGGGSVLWGTWSFRPMPVDFKLKTLFSKTRQLDALMADGYSVADWPIDYAELFPFFGVAEALLGVSGKRSAVNESIRQSPWYQELSQQFGGEAFFGTETQWFPQTEYPLGPYPITPVGQLVADGFESKGMRAFPTPMAIVQPGSGGANTRKAIEVALANGAGAPSGDIWKKAAADLWSEQVRQACNMCGFCGEYLCWAQTGSKWGTQDSVLKELDALPNVTIRPKAKAVEVLFDAESRRATGVAYLNLDKPEDPRREECYADYVVLSCGAVQSARLLSLSGPEPGLGNATDQLGRNATFHLFGLGARATLTERFQGLLHSEFGPTGNTSTSWSYFLKDGQGWVKGGHLTSSAAKNPLEAAVGAAKAGLIGDKLLDRVLENNRKFDVRLTGDDLPMPDNRVTLDSKYVDEYGIPVARITRATGSNEARLFNACKPILSGIFDKYTSKGHMGALDITDRILTLVGDHQMGTCRMGDDPTQSVVNRFCRLHDAENVFVVDSSFMPTGLGLNPMVTVVANALRVGTHIIDSLRRGKTPGAA